jgi:sugar-specific transcriptional regulator TrmB
LDHGPQSASELAKTTSVKRTYVYTVITELVTKGLTAQTKKGRATVFSAQSPDKLLDLAESQKLAAEQARLSLENVLPTLKSQHALSETKPVVTYFEGMEGVKRAYLESVLEKKEILAYVEYTSTSNKVSSELEKFWPQYFRLRQENNVFARVLSPDTPQARKYQKLDKEQLRQTLLLPKTSFPPDVEKNIIGNKVYFFSRSENQPIATIIENQFIAQTERAIFESIWKQLT